MPRLLIFLVLLITTLPNTYAQRQFTPIYGNNNDMNRTVSFITENLVLDSLTYSRLSSLQGSIRCTFSVDKTGRITDIKIARGLAYWINYEISMAMNALPTMEPFKNKHGEPIHVNRDMYFTFNSSEKDKWPVDPFKYDPQISKSIEEQRAEFYAKLIALDKNWDKFQKDNSKISLDGKGVYKPGVLTQNPLKIKDLPPRPPVRITIESQE